jgi:hypothetical protein
VAFVDYFDKSAEAGNSAVRTEKRLELRVDPGLDGGVDGGGWGWGLSILVNERAELS